MENKIEEVKEQLTDVLSPPNILDQWHVMVLVTKPSTMPISKIVTKKLPLEKGRTSKFCRKKNLHWTNAMWIYSNILLLNSFPLVLDFKNICQKETGRIHNRIHKLLIMPHSMSIISSSQRKVWALLSESAAVISYPV